MASKIIENIQVSIGTNLKTGESSATCTAVCFSPDLGAQFAVSVPLVGDGVTSLASSALEALKGHLSEGGHTVTEAELQTEPES